MPDRDLSGDDLKLVRYKVLFIKRDYEHAFPEDEALVSDNMDGGSFTAWKIAEFIQHLERVGIAKPESWKDYPEGDQYFKDGKLVRLPDADKKYLRLYFEVLDRYPREEAEYDRKQVDVLKKISSKIG